MVNQVWNYMFRQPVIELREPIGRARISGAGVSSEMQQALDTGIARANLAYAALTNSDNPYGVEVLPQQPGELVIGRDIVDVARGAVTHTYGIRQLRVATQEPTLRDMREEEVLRATLGHLINTPVTRSTLFLRNNHDFHILDLEMARTPNDARVLPGYF